MVFHRSLGWVGRFTPTFAGLTGLLLSVSFGHAEEEWTSFRGPNGDGVSVQKNLPLTWSADENIKWRRELPAPGNGSPIVSKNQLFLVSADENGHQRSLLCFDVATGSPLWQRDVAFDTTLPTHKTNPFGSSTPATDGKSVVVWHASAGLYCYDFDGKELWHRQLGEFRHMWGYGTSPILHRGNVILHSGPGADVFVTSIDLQSGQTNWTTNEPVEGNDRNSAGKYLGSWSTPVVATMNGREIIVCSMPTRVVGYSIATGRELFSCTGLQGSGGDLAYTSPIVAGEVCVAMGGFRGPALGFRMNAEGDLTDNRLWHSSSRNPQRIGTGVVVDGLVYMANAGPNTFQCIEPETGEIRWEARNNGAAHWASMLSADGHIFAIDQDGTTHVIRPNPERLEVVARNALDEHTNATPAIYGGNLFIRTHQHLYCVGQ